MSSASSLDWSWQKQSSNFINKPRYLLKSESVKTIPCPWVSEGHCPHVLLSNSLHLFKLFFCSICCYFSSRLWVFVMYCDRILWIHLSIKSWKTWYTTGLMSYEELGRAYFFLEIKNFHIFNVHPNIDTWICNPCF